MRSQRGVESECRCWNPGLWVLVTLLGTLVFVALTVLTRLGECVHVGVNVHVHVHEHERVHEY